jgi:DNA-binding NarL/FixJ family response regulator
MRPTLSDAADIAGLAVVAECDDAAQLVDAIRREHPALCVVDRDLRGGGLAATAAIAMPRVAPKVVVVGGHGAEAELRAARLAGAADCVPEDIGPAGLAAALRALIEKERP